MLKDHNHDLIHQLSESSDSLWRVEEYYNNAEGCSECQAIWQKISDDLSNHTEMLKGEIERHVREGRFD